MSPRGVPLSPRATNRGETSPSRPSVRALRGGALAVGLAVVVLAVACALFPGPVTLGLLIVALYLGLRLVVRSGLARHDRPLMAPLGEALGEGRIDEDLLDAARTRLVHPALRSSVAVALAHLRADRGDWDGTRRCLDSIGPLWRGVLRRALDERCDGATVSAGVRVVAARARFGRLIRLGSDLPAEVLFCAVAILHGRGLYRRAFAVGQRAWVARPEAVTAYNCACALARLGCSAEALHWLAAALDAGYPPGELAREEDLASLRPLPEFVAAQRRSDTEGPH